MDTNFFNEINDIQLEDNVSNILLPKDYYRLKIPNEVRHYYKNKGYIAGYSNKDISNFSFANVDSLYTSSAIELQPNDIIQIIIPKMLLEKAYEDYKQYTSVTKNILRLLTFPDKPRVDDKGKIDFTELTDFGAFNFITSTGNLSKYTKEMSLQIVYNNSKFIDLDFYVYTREITQYYYELSSKYIYLIDWIPKDYPKSHLIDEQNRIYNCGILRKGKDPYDNWQDQQNNLAFKHYLYQSHIRKEK